MKKPQPSTAFLSRKRARKAEYLRLNRRARSHRYNSRGVLQPWAGRPADDYLIKLRKCAADRPAPGRTIVHIPRKFSIIDAPEDALRAIGLVASAARRTEVAEIHYDHSALTEYDLAAETILDIVALNVYKRRRLGRQPMRPTGTLPENPDANRFVRAMGITHHLGIRDVGLHTSEQDSLHRFAHLGKVPNPQARATIDSMKAVVLAKFANHINQCLATVQHELTAPGRAALLGYTGEIIDNIEQHGQSHEWHMAGYLDTRLSPPVCEVAIFNFGRTFAESFLELPVESYARSVVTPYIEAHERGGWFSTSWRAEDLLTLIALQGGISCKQVENSNDMRGQGTVELILFFQSMFDEYALQTQRKARMAILSGDTHILFDGTYRMDTDSKGRQVLAFNSENSLARPPDTKFVRHLRGVRFPGTVVSIRFPLEHTAALGEH